MIYNICPSKETALININKISKNLIKNGFSGHYSHPLMIGCNVSGSDYVKHFYIHPDQELMDKYYDGIGVHRILEDVIDYELTSDDPSLLTPDKYAIYELLTKDAITFHTDNTIPPTAIDFKRELQPLLNKELIFDKGGHLIEANYYEFDYDLKVNIRPILQMNAVWLLDPNSGPYPTAQKVLERTKNYEWFDTNELVPDNIDNLKSHRKAYLETNSIRNEGYRRRQACANNIFEGFVSLCSVLCTEFDQSAAENIIGYLLTQFTDDYNNYLNSGLFLPDSIDNYSDTLPIYVHSTEGVKTVNDILSTVIVDNPFTNSNEYGSRGVLDPNITLKEYLVESFKGNI